MNLDHACKNIETAAVAPLAGRSSMHVLSKAEVLRFIRERRRLFDAAAQDNPFAASAWMLHFIEEVARDDWLFGLPHCLGDGESLLLLHADPKARYRWLAVSNCYTSLYTPFISSARNRGAALDTLVEQLVEGQDQCAVVQLAPLDSGSPDTVALEQAFVRRGWYVKRYFCFGNWYLPCANLSFDRYMAGRDSQLHNTWLRKAKKFERAAGGNTRLEIITDSRDVDAAMEAYERVYAKSWKQSEGYPSFVRNWARVCASQGWLRLGLAWVEGVPVAAQFWFTLHGRANIFKLAYDEAYTKWSAGTVLSAHLFRYSLDQDRVSEIDYLTGDDAYKCGWVSARRERIGLLACNPRTMRGLLLAAVESAGDMARPWRRLLRHQEK